VGDVMRWLDIFFFAHDMDFVWKEDLWRLRSRSLFFGFFFIFGHGWVVVVAHEVTSWDCTVKGTMGDLIVWMDTNCWPRKQIYE
jgi:hypothetical protein